VWLRPIFSRWWYDQLQPREQNRDVERYGWNVSPQLSHGLDAGGLRGRCFVCTLLRCRRFAHSTEHVFAERVARAAGMGAAQISHTVGLL
jgi:hypothetical protein